MSLPTLIVTHAICLVLGAIAGALIYRKHRDHIELLRAQRHAAKSGKWVGRIQGFAIGIGVGYVGGKL